MSIQLELKRFELNKSMNEPFGYQLNVDCHLTRAEFQWNGFDCGNEAEEVVECSQKSNKRRWVGGQRWETLLQNKQRQTNAHRRNETRLFVCLVASVFAARYHGRPKLKLIFIKFNQQFLKCVLKSSKLEFGAMSNGGPIENISTYSIQILEKEIWLIKSIND